MLLSSKLVDPLPVGVAALVMYTDYTYHATELLEMEQIILDTLNNCS